jgi:hypothetical protein
MVVSNEAIVTEARNQYSVNQYTRKVPRRMTASA